MIHVFCRPSISWMTRTTNSSTEFPMAVSEVHTVEIYIYQSDHILKLCYLATSFNKKSPTHSYFLIPSLVSGISVSSKNDGVFVLHVPIDEKADKVCLKYSI